MNKFHKIKKKKVGIHFRLGDYRLEKSKEVFYNIDYSSIDFGNGRKCFRVFKENNTLKKEIL